MKKETRTVVYDDELRMEAYRFEGIVQPFPNHFHEHYVIGFVESGQRVLSCKNKEYNIEKGNMVLFNPGDNHACVQSDEGTFDYCGFNISKQIMLDLVEEITGKRELPGFSKNVIWDDEISCYLHPLHEMVMKGNSDLGKEENLLFLISTLIQKYGKPFESCLPECPQEIEKACEFMRHHFQERIYLDQICHYVTLGKKMPEVVGADVTDKSGNEHLGIIEFPVPILKGNPESIKEIREKLYDPDYSDLTVVDFSDLAQGCKTYDEFSGKMGEVSENDLNYFGITICGAKKKVNKLTGSMALLR